MSDNQMLVLNRADLESLGLTWREIIDVLDDAFQHSLAPGGRLLAIVGEAPVMTAKLITCEAAGAFRASGLFETSVAALRNAPQPERFVF